MSKPRQIMMLTIVLVISFGIALTAKGQTPTSAEIARTATSIKLDPQNSTTAAIALLAIGSVLQTSPTKAINLDQESNRASAPQVIEICKKTIPAGGTGFPFTWTNGAGPSTFLLNDGQCTIKNITGQDHHNEITENVPAGWTLTNIVCNATTSPVKFIGTNPHPGFQSGDNTVVMDLSEQKVKCTFHNRRLPQCCSWSLDLSTGQGNGLIDPLWTLNNGNAYTVSNAGPLSGVWLGLPPARWVQPANSSTPLQVSGGTYIYQIKFKVPACNSGTVKLTGSFAADNSAEAYLDGVAILGASCPGPECFKSTQGPVSLNAALTPGPHVLEIRVENESRRDPSHSTEKFIGATYSGVIVNARLTRVCPP